MHKNSKEVQLPTIEEFKAEAKRRKSSGQFEVLGHAQNKMALEYGFKDYNAIKPKLKKQDSNTLEFNSSDYAPNKIKVNNLARRGLFEKTLSNLNILIQNSKQISENKYSFNISTVKSMDSFQDAFEYKT